MLSKSGAPAAILVAGGIFYAEHQDLMRTAQESSKAQNLHSARLMRMETQLEIITVQLKDVWDFCRERRWGHFDESKSPNTTVSTSTLTNQISKFR